VTATLLPSLEGFLEALAANPGDDAAAHGLADWLDEAGPTPVQLHRLPNWLRLAWLRSVPRDGFYRHTDGGSVAMEINHRLGTQAWGHLDHWGTTEIDGRPCLVTEPYREPAEVLAQCRLLASLAGGIPAYARRSAWGHGTVRGLLFPPPEDGYARLISATNTPPVGRKPRTLAEARAGMVRAIRRPCRPDHPGHFLLSAKERNENKYIRI
jgi:uncharacterized protein (TIGR02996 family)